MNPRVLSQTPLYLAITIALPLQTVEAASGPNAISNGEIEEMLITASRDNRTSKGATGLSLDIKSTPQSISIIDQALMRDFGADSLNDALRLAPGITVEEWETNRTNYVSRGFSIKSTQIDGVGLPNDWGLVTGEMEAYGFEKIEVIRGANGLLTGVGNASGTINYVRKRPTNTSQGSVSVTAGSWDLLRLEGDYSTPLTDDGRWAGRVVAALEEQDSYLRALENDRTFLYGVVDGQIGERGTLTAGYSYQQANTDGNMWGALVLGYADGTQAEFGRSASTTMDWTYWDTTRHNAFVEYVHTFASGWEAKFTYNYRQLQEESQLFFALAQSGLDPQTNLGLFGWAGSYPTREDAHLFDLSLTGNWSLLGREHELVIGASRADGRSKLHYLPVDPADPVNGALPPFPYGGDALPEPHWGPRVHYSLTNSELTRIYGAARLDLHDRVTALVGFNAVEHHRDGDELGATFGQTEREVSPYVGITVDLTDDLLAYASYSDIYEAQDYRDFDGSYLAPTKGVNYELGLKGEWFDQRLLTTVAVFTAEQEGLGTFAGVNTDNLQYYYTREDIKSEGIELEASGSIGEYIDVVFGATWLRLEDDAGDNTYRWVPRRKASLAISSRLPFNPDVSLGVAGRWQSDISNVDGYSGSRIRQDSYAVLNAFARWQMNANAYVAVNLNNIADEKYLTSLYEVGFYAAPRNGSVTIGYDF